MDWERVEWHVKQRQRTIVLKSNLLGEGGGRKNDQILLSNECMSRSTVIEWSHGWHWCCLAEKCSQDERQCMLFPVYRPL